MGLAESLYDPDSGWKSTKIQAQRLYDPDLVQKSVQPRFRLKIYIV